MARVARLDDEDTHKQTQKAAASVEGGPCEAARAGAGGRRRVRVGPSVLLPKLPFRHVKEMRRQVLKDQLQHFIRELAQWRELCDRPNQPHTIAAATSAAEKRGESNCIESNRLGRCDSLRLTQEAAGECASTCRHQLGEVEEMSGHQQVDQIHRGTKAAKRLVRRRLAQGHTREETGGRASTTSLSTPTVDGALLLLRPLLAHVS